MSDSTTRWTATPPPPPGSYVHGIFQTRLLDLPDPGIEPASPTPQADSSLPEPPGKEQKINGVSQQKRRKNVEEKKLKVESEKTVSPSPTGTNALGHTFTKLLSFSSSYHSEGEHQNSRGPYLSGVTLSVSLKGGGSAPRQPGESIFFRQTYRGQHSVAIRLRVLSLNKVSQELTEQTKEGLSQTEMKVSKHSLNNKVLKAAWEYRPCRRFS